MVEIVKAQKLAALKDIRSLLKKEKYNTISKYLLSIPGIGPYTAISLMTEVDEISRFSTFEKFNCFIGFYPSEFSSGEHIHKGNITGRKHNQLRSLLIEAAWVLVRTDPAMTLVYNQLKLDKGGKRAIVKIARKLLSRIRYVWMNQKPYVKGVIK
ncbi:MAG: transposase [Bacteroidetes bacterium]|nr:transposase [Bacteroidota bacterium]